MALSAPGLGSSLDVNGLVSQLMTAESTPLKQLATKEAAYQAKLSAYGSMKSALATLQNTMSGLASPQAYQALRASVGDSSLATASASSAAQAGTYDLEILTLAQAQKLKSAALPAVTDRLGSGSITIQFGTYANGGFALNPEKAAQTIIIPASGDSLAAVKDAINAANAGVSATVVNDGGGNRMVLAAAATGAANAMRITVVDDDAGNTDASGLSRLAYDASTGGTTNLLQTVAPLNASLTLDGISISKSSNVITDAIEGVKITLSKAGGPTTLGVNRDSTSTQAAAVTFVQSWNAAFKTLRDLGAYDAQTKSGAVLQGDSTLLSAQNRLRALINQPLTPATGGLASLSEIGISFQRDGSLALDATKLSAMLADKSKDVSTLFASVGKSSDSLVSFATGSSDARAGVYEVSVSALATRGSVTGSTAANLTITAGSNDTLDIVVDGVAATVTLTPGSSYTADSLAAELQSRINGSASLRPGGNSVMVTQAGGVLSIVSAKYGSASTVAISGGNGASGLLGVPTGVAGVNAAGTIGGVAAVGAGQFLSASGLTLQINGGPTGSRGTVSYSRGVADQTARLLGSVLASNGPVDSRTQGVNASIKGIGTQRTAVNARLAQIEKRYRAQFTALDAMVSRMTTTSSFLTQQLSNLPGSGE